MNSKRYDEDGNRVVSGKWFANPIDREALRTKAGAFGRTAADCLARAVAGSRADYLVYGPLATRWARDAAAYALTFMAAEDSARAPADDEGGAA